MRAIFKKELRDLLPWIVVGMVLIAAMCWYGKDEKSRVLAELLPIGFAAVALGFGFLQTLGDMRTEAKGYLLHRPVGIRSIFWGKLLAGAVAYGATLVLPLIGLAIYQELMGPERKPLSAVELIPSLLMSIVVFSLHPAAMWAVSRQARWVGTKAVPLAVALLGWLLAYTLLFAYTKQAYFSLFWAGFALTVLATLVIVTGAAFQAFCESQFLPPVLSGRPLIRFGNLGILSVCGFAVSAATLIVSAFLYTDADYPYTDHDLALSHDGQLWDFAQTTLSSDDYWNPEVAVAKLAVDPQRQQANLQSRPADWTERAKAGLGTYDIRRVWEQEFKYLTQFEFSSTNYWDVNKRDNQLLVYSHRGLQAVLTPDGFYDSVADAKGAFDDPSFARSGGRLSDRKTHNDSVGIGQSLIYDRNGVYQVDWKARTIRTVLDQPNEGIALVLPTSDQDAVFWVRSGSTVKRYLIEPLEDGVSFELADSELIKRARRFRFPDIKATKTDEWSFPPGADGKPLLATTDEMVTVAETGDGTTLFYRGFGYPVALVNYELKAKDGSIERSGEVVFPARTKPDHEWFGLFLPPAVSAAIMTFGTVKWSLVIVGYVLIHGLLVAAFTFWLSRYYELTAFCRNLWLPAAMTLGLAAPLAMWMIYPKLIRERCHHCEAMRRIDLARCRQCGADWARQPTEGNEIIGAAPIHQQAANVS